MQQVPQALSCLLEEAARSCTRGGGHESVPSVPTSTLLAVFDERNCLLEIIHTCTELEWNSPTPGYQRYLCLHRYHGGRYLQLDIQHTIFTVWSIIADHALNSLANYTDTFIPLFPGVIDCLFSELEDEQGCVFVSHALGYIATAKYGLTESELLDVLTCDADVSTKNITTIDYIER